MLSRITQSNVDAIFNFYLNSDFFLLLPVIIFYTVRGEKKLAKIYLHIDNLMITTRDQAEICASTGCKKFKSLLHIALYLKEVIIFQSILYYKLSQIF
jgi:hypothetical protein